MPNKSGNLKLGLSSFGKMLQPYQIFRNSEFENRNFQMMDLVEEFPFKIPYGMRISLIK